MATHIWYAAWGNVAEDPLQIFWLEDQQKTGYQFSFEDAGARRYNRRFMRSSDGGRTIDVQFPHSESFEYTDGKLFVARIVRGAP